MIGKNVMALSLEDNEDMRNVFTGKAPGDEVLLESVECVVQEVTTDQVVLRITKIEPEEESVDSGGEEDSSPKDESPALVLVGGKKNPLVLGEE